MKFQERSLEIDVREKIDAGLRDCAAGRVVTAQQIRRALNITRSEPALHRKLVRARRAAYERGEVATLTMDQLAKSVRRR